MSRAALLLCCVATPVAAAATPATITATGLGIGMAWLVAIAAGFSTTWPTTPTTAAAIGALFLARLNLPFPA